MSRLLTYTADKKRDLARSASKNYKDNWTRLLTFEDWKCGALPILKGNPTEFNVTPIDYSKPVRVAKSTVEMLAICHEHQNEIDAIKYNAQPHEKDFLLTKLCKEILEPKLVINKPEGFHVKGVTNKGKEVDVPVWFNSSLKGVTFRLGYANLDSATPGSMPLNDEKPHGLLAGMTGSGKSVALNTIIGTSMLEYPPWELALFLMDMKVVEFIRYANRITPPHVKMVGATGSTEFVLSLFEQLQKEMYDRQALFGITGVKDLSEFRKKYNLIIPRIVLIEDEFVQMYENLKKAALMGSTDSDDQKSLISATISELARLGRSYGLHLFLSSQNMEGQMDEQTAGQFQMGAALAAPASVSKSIIGNEAATTLAGKGKGIVNTNKLAGDEKQNVLTRIPYICSELSEEETAAGKLPYLQELLLDLKNIGDEVGWKDTLTYYDEREEIPFQLFTQDLELGKEHQQNPGTGREITDRLFHQEITKTLVIGRQVKYAPNPVAFIDLKTRRMNNIVVSGDLDSRSYMLGLLADNLVDDDFEHYVVVADEAIAEMSGVSNKLPNVTRLKAKSLPSIVWQKMQTRSDVLQLQSIMEDHNGGVWDTTLAIRTMMGDVRVPVGDKFTRFCEIMDDLVMDRVSEEEGVQKLSSEADVDFDARGMRELMQRVITTYSGLKIVTENFTKPANVNSFKRVFVWFMGLDEQSDLVDSDIKKLYAKLFSDGPAFGIHSIVTGTYWDKVGSLTLNCNYIMERGGKQFFMDCELPVRVNLNMNSFQLLSREDKTNLIIRIYRLIGKVA